MKREASGQPDWNATWYATGYRKLFFDFHSDESVTELAAGFDATGWAETLRTAGAQAVSVFTKCGRGWSFHRKGSIRYVHPNLPNGLDMLQEQIDALHAAGLKAIGYYHTLGSQPLALYHPGWVKRDRVGNPRDPSICMLGPSLEEWVLPHVAEIVANYDVDAMFFDGTRARDACYCHDCTERFRAETGMELLDLDEPEVYTQYVTWKLKAYRRIRQRICEAVHAEKPALPVSFNWCYAMAQPEPVPEAVGNLMIDIRPENQVFEGSYQAKFWAMLDRPFDIMNSAFLRWWGDWACKPATALQQEVATIIANRGLTWIGYQMTHAFTVEPAVLRVLGETLAFVKARERLLKKAETLPCIAVLNSTHNYLAQGEPRFMIDETGLRGAHRILLESSLPHSFLHGERLRSRLRDFAAVIVPDQRYLPDALVEDLREFVEQGGALIVTAMSGTLDADYTPTGHLALGDLLGVRLVGEYEQSAAYIDVQHPPLQEGALDMPHLCEGRFALVETAAEDVKTLAGMRRMYLRGDGRYLLSSSPPGEDSGHPAITLRKVGKGHAVYIAGPLFAAFQRHGQWNLKHLAANLLRLVLGDRLLRVQSPLWLEIVLTRQRRKTLIHLVNHHGGRQVDKTHTWSEQVPTVRGVTVSWPCARPKKVLIEPGKRTPEWRHEDGVLHVTVDELHIHAAIVID